MKTYSVNLSCTIPRTFYTDQAAQSVDINIEEKSKHSVEVEADFETPFNIGVIVGASGTGKTALAKSIFGDNCFKEHLDLTKPLIDQFPQGFSYDERASFLTGVGLTSIPCWIRPAFTLSNGQRQRANVALSVAFSDKGIVCIDEYSSLVDRTVGQIMSNSIQKFARKKNIKLVLCSCHFDVIDFLNPDFVVNLDQLTYEERRSLSSSYQRKTKLEFDVRKVSRKTWSSFSSLHYMTDKIPGGLGFYFGLFHKNIQIGFLSFHNYVPHRKHSTLILHGSRIVLRGDYAGFGLSIPFLNASCKQLKESVKCEIRTTSSSVPMMKAQLKDRHWKLVESELVLGKAASEKMRKYSVDKKTFSRLNKPTSFRKNVKLFKFHWVGGPQEARPTPLKQT